MLILFGKKKTARLRGRLLRHRLKLFTVCFEGRLGFLAITRFRAETVLPIRCVRLDSGDILC